MLGFWLVPSGWTQHLTQPRAFPPEPWRTPQSWAWLVGAFPCGSAVKNPPTNAEVCLIPGSGRSSGRGNGNPLQCSCLENPMDREPGGLQPLRSQGVAHDLETKQ